MEPVNFTSRPTPEAPARTDLRAPEINSFGFAILVGLNRLGKHVYAGTVPAQVKAKRRQANKAARIARRAARA